MPGEWKKARRYMVRKLMKTVSVITLSMALLFGVSARSYATEPEANISNKTIPVTATIETYYEVITPAGLGADGALHLTRDYDDYIKTDGDTTSTFYGYTSVA